MNKAAKVIITFIVSFIIAYIVVGYVTKTVFAQIHWVEGATIWDKLREYYIRTASVNIVPTFIIAIVSTSIIHFSNRNKREN